MPATGQLPLSLRPPPDQRLETFVAAPPGALDHLRALANGTHSDWVFLAGPPASGKTHLLLGVLAQAREAGRRAGYLPLAAASGRLREALDAMEDHDLLALDGVEAVIGSQADEVALFDAHNRARASGTTLVYAARQAPDALSPGLADLQSRLSQCTRLVLAPLDDAGRREVLRTRALRRGWALEDAALDWLLRRTGRDLAGLTLLLDRLDRASLAAQRRVTVPFLRQVLGTPGN
ncbi:DnaA regulatory inactivator Hda [Lysobacter sp. A3-1-A15]|uniref:DnaA regulatory inactivator Hda n=1 Tax=Novilysobacter viscosus TaxID=3098602 RepID=UPI003983443D